MENAEIKKYLKKSFSHIYVEEKILNHERTGKILAMFPGSNVVPLKNYKDIFNRKKQDYLLSHKSAGLILAAKEDGFLQRGAPVCQNFGNAHFYYTSCAMNCLFDCEYCYLKGMYPSGYNVIFVNIEDYFRETEKILGDHPVYLCISYDTDLMAEEKFTGYTRAWSEFAAAHDGSDGGNPLSIEVRTKSAGKNAWDRLLPHENVIFAFTLSPQSIIDSYEGNTPSLAARLSCIKEGMRRGFPVRLCFDPMIFCRDWKAAYGHMLDQVLSEIDLKKVRDISVGSFRISGDYLKQMRKMEPMSAVVWYPFSMSGGYYHYDKQLMNEMEGFLIGKLEKYVGPEKIFCWDKS